MKYIDSNFRRQCTGFTLLELGIILAIIGFVTAGIWAAADSAYSNYKVNRTVDQLFAIVENLRGRYQAARALPLQTFTVFTQAAAQADVFPAETKLNPNAAPANCTVATPCYFANPWDPGDGGAICGGGSICVASVANAAFTAPLGAVTAYNYAVMLRNLPGPACAAIASKLAAVWDDIGLIAMGVDTADNAVPGTIYTVPQTVSTWAGACNGANLNHLYFAFRM